MQVYILKIFLLCLELEVIREDVIDEVVKVVTLDEPLALVARVLGLPAQLVVGLLTFHEMPHWSAHHWDWTLVGKEEQLAGLVYLNSVTEELTCACVDGCNVVVIYTLLFSYQSVHENQLVDGPPTPRSCLDAS